MIFPRKGRKGWVVISHWEKCTIAKGKLVNGYKGIWEVAIKDGAGEFSVIADKCDIYTSRRRAKRKAAQYRRAASA